MRRGLLVAAAAVALAQVGARASAAVTSPQAFTPVADGFVSAATPRNSYGRARSLALRARPPARAYLRFRVAGLAGDAVSTRLRVYVNNGRGTLQVRAVARRGWSERSLSYRTAPRLGRVVATARIAGRGWRNLNVGSLVRAAGVIDLALVARRGSLAVASRETRHKPTLLVTTAPALLAAGDIASCASNGDEATAPLLNGSASIAALGDLAYESGTAAEFANCYGPTWGRFKSRTHPALGNHEYQTPGATGYFGYWGAAAGAPGAGYYSYDLGAWHIVVLNSNCGFVACSAGSLQETWLRNDLAVHRARCTLAYWHHPLFSSTPGTPNPAVQPLWQALFDAGADVVLTGHAHNYQRFAPQTPSGGADSARGIREFVVGTGGKERHYVGAAINNQEVANDTTFGVLRLTLLASGYRWRFVPQAGGVFHDAGSGTCH